MFLVVGLGNPGSGYARNRHNIGFMAADTLVRRHSFGPWRAKFQGEVSEGSLNGEKLCVLKPATFMNLSGQAVAAAARFYKVTPEQIIILHDELDLIFGKVRVKRGGGSGGHNGIKSIDQHCGKDTLRVRLGIGHPGHKDLVTDYVLGDFGKAERDDLELLLDTVADEFPLLLNDKDNEFMTRVAQKTRKDDKTNGL